MDMKELETFLTLAQTLNYKKASDTLNYSPSTLEHHIHVIEGELGGRLFDRDGRGLALTEEGKKLIPYAEEILALYRRAVSSMAAEPARKLSIAGSEATASYAISDLLTAYTGRYPDVRLNLYAGPNSATPEIVMRGDAELGFYYSFDTGRIRGLSDVVLFREPNCLICSRDNPLAARGPVRYADLGGCAFVFPHDDCLSAVDTLERLRQAQVSPGRISYPGSMSLVLDAARNENAVTSLPYSAARRLATHDGMAILAMEEETVWVYARLLYKKRELLSEQAWKLLCLSIDYAQECVRKDPAIFLKT